MIKSKKVDLKILTLSGENVGKSLGMQRNLHRVVSGVQNEGDCVLFENQFKMV